MFVGLFATRSRTQINMNDPFEAGKDSTSDATVSRIPPHIEIPISDIVESAEAFIKGNPKNDTPFAGLNDQLAEAAKEANPLPEDEPDSDKSIFNP